MSVDFFIFVPAYNVATTLAPVLQKVSDEVWNRSIVLVIDDGSVDDTRGSFENFVEALNDESAGTQKKSRLRYMRFEQNNGYGAVVKKGIAEGLRSGAKFIACLHGDGQYPAAAQMHRRLLRRPVGLLKPAFHRPLFPRAAAVRARQRSP